MSQQKVVKLQVNDLFNELKDENERLLTQLLFAQKCIEILENYRNYLTIFCNSCQCDQSSQIKTKLNDLESDLKAIDNQKGVIFKSDKSVNSLTETESPVAVIKHKKLKIKLKQVKNKTKKIAGVNKKITRKSLAMRAPNISEPEDNCIYKIHTNNNLKTCNNRLVSSQQQFTESHNSLNRVDLALKSKVKKIKGVKGFCCDFCDYTNISFNRVESHMNKEHINIRPYKCDKCELSFTGKHLLNGHIKLMHSNVRYYCDWNECKFETINYNSLKEHRLRHIGDKQFKCLWPACERSFITKSELMGHQKRVHNDYRAYRCEWPACDSSFKTSQDLKHHMCTHTGQKIHRCEWPGCEWRFTRKPQLDRHMLIHKEVRNFSCTWPECDKKFRTSCALKVHLMVHRGDRPFRCEWPQCDRRFTEKANMLRHLRTHNNKLKSD